MKTMKAMESVLVEVYVPATDEAFDFLLPAAGIVGEMAAQMADALESAGRNIVFDRTALILCTMGEAAISPRILPGDATLQASGIIDGARLMLL